MKVIIMLSALILTGCSFSNKSAESESPLNIYEMQCSHTSHHLERCENEEVICYSKYISSSKGGVFCKFKGGVNE